MSNSTQITAWDFSSGTLPYYDQLYKTALRMTRSVQDTEDLLQETFLKAYRYYDGFEEGTNLKAWLFRIMKNNFINGYRKRKVEPARVDFDEFRDSAESSSPDAIIAGETDPEATLMDSEVDHDVARAIEALPHDYKMALLLVDIQGHTYQEVADILAVPVGTVMSRLYRGRAKIEKALLSYGKRYRYLTKAPAKLRDSSIDVDRLFADDAARERST
jgi:RNA polymerase sigma-70 factor (ECF subfamily)